MRDLTAAAAAAAAAANRPFARRPAPDRFCEFMDEQLAENSSQKLVVYCSADRRERTNTAFLLGAYMASAPFPPHSHTTRTRRSFVARDAQRARVIVAQA